MRERGFFLPILAPSRTSRYEYPHSSMLHPNPSLQDLVADARQGPQDRLNAEATLVATAPGRVNLIGEHIDYCDGFVLPLAIERYVVIAARANDTNTARIHSEGQGMVEIDLSEEQTISDPKWSNYLRGVIKGFQVLNYRIPGFDACIVSSIPPGAGLSSSAALECAFATLLEGLVDTVLPTRKKALLAQKAEHEFAQVPCGIMDQFASAYGKVNHLILIDCHSGDPELVPFSDPSLSIIVANTNVSHDLSDGAYAARRKSTEDALATIGKKSWRDVTMDDVLNHENDMDEVTFRRARHVVSEIARTIEAVESFRSKDFSKIGPLMAGSHRSLKQDFEVSCDELDLMVEIANDIGFEGGVLGARMTGGGFGGSTVTLCRTHDAPQIAETLHQRYLEKTGITPLVFATRPAAGAHLV